MDTNLDDTIAAMASAPGPAMRSILRVSGIRSREVIDSRLIADSTAEWEQTQSAGRFPGRFRLPQDRMTVPVAVYLWPTRRSYTGEPMAEIHLPGSPAVAEAVLMELYRLGVRPSRPGEFTLRAFLAGRIDLVQAEAVLGVIDAHDHEELEVALKQLAGGFSTILGEVRNELLELLADLEAGLDFVDEDIEFVSRAEVIDRIDQARQTLGDLLEQSRMRMQSTGRSRVVLAGLPNAGKSSLFNALSGREEALVSEIRGTTRDYLTVAIDHGGISLDLIDTAGVEAESDPLTSQMQELRSDQVARADVIVWCTAADLPESQAAVDRECLNEAKAACRRVLHVTTKSDLVAPDVLDGTSGGLQASARTGTGLNSMLDAIADSLSTDAAASRQWTGMTAARAQESLEPALAAIELARAASVEGHGDELISIELRETLEHLGRILGAVYTDDVLDRIFSKFCIGK